MLSRPGRHTATLLFACTLLTGCQPPAPTPIPTASYRCTPEAGGAEYECTPHEHDDMVAKDKLYTEAEAVYRRFLAEDERILRAGGLITPTPVLKETATGAFLADSLDYYRSLAEEKSRLMGGEVHLVALRRQPGVAKGGSLVALKACIDASSARIVIGTKHEGPGRKGSDVLYFGRVGGLLKIQGADGKEGDECG
jgi:hypothetical protein